MTNVCKINKEDMKYITKLLDNDINNAEDDLNRAELSFKGQNLKS